MQEEVFHYERIRFREPVIFPIHAPFCLVIQNVQAGQPLSTSYILCGLPDIAHAVLEGALRLTQSTSHAVRQAAFVIYSCPALSALSDSWKINGVDNQGNYNANSVRKVKISTFNAAFTTRSAS